MAVYTERHCLDLFFEFARTRQGNGFGMSLELTLRQRRALSSIARPLGLIFWGAFFWFFDFKIVNPAPPGRFINFLPDSVGLTLVAIGISILAFSSLFTGKAELAATLSAGVFIMLAIGSIANEFTPALSNLATLGNVILNLVAGFAVVAFCGAMSELASGFGLTEIAGTWFRVGFGFVILYTVPWLVVVLFPAPAFLLLLSSAVLLLYLAVSFLAVTRRLRRVALAEAPTARGSMGTC